MAFFVFVDNSNVWIKGKIASAVLKGWAKNPIEAHKKSIEDTSWRIDFGKLLDCVTGGHISEIKKAVLFGSKPPHTDSLWKAMASANFEVAALDRNVAGKEKAIDTGIVMKIAECLYTEATQGDTFILVMGDRDYKPALEHIRKKDCKSVVAFWNNASAEFTSEADNFLDLTPMLKAITH